MGDTVIVICAPVDPDDAERLLQGLQPRGCSPGSIATPCHVCSTDCWLSKSGQRFVRRTALRVTCPRCALGLLEGQEEANFQPVPGTDPGLVSNTVRRIIEAVAERQGQS